MIGGTTQREEQQQKKSWASKAEQVCPLTERTFPKGYTFYIVTGMQRLWTWWLLTCTISLFFPLLSSTQKRKEVHNFTPVALFSPHVSDVTSHCESAVSLFLQGQSRPRASSMRNGPARLPLVFSLCHGPRRRRRRCQFYNSVKGKLPSRKFTPISLSTGLVKYFYWLECKVLSAALLWGPAALAARRYGDMSLFQCRPEENAAAVLVTARTTFDAILDPGH